MWGDESEAVAPIIWLYQIVDAQKEEVFFPDLLITLWSYALGQVFTSVSLHDDCYEGRAWRQQCWLLPTRSSYCVCLGVAAYPRASIN